MGTPEFAVPSLRALIAREGDVVGVVTQPDRPKGRGEILTPSPVKEVAQTHEVPVYQPDRVKHPDFIKRVEGLRPDLIVVVAFGQILPAALLAIPRQGAINVHASLLPYYRGAAPIASAILRGESETGVTTMKMDEGMDTGPILLQRKTEILPDDTAGTLADRLSRIGAELLIETLDRLSEGSLKAIPQDSTRASNAPLLKKEDGRIDWSKSAVEIERQIRAMDPWPGAHTFYQGRLWRLWAAQAIEEAPEGRKEGEKAGGIVRADRSGLEVSTGKGYIRISFLQPENRRRMSAAEFLAGHPVEVGTVLSSTGEQT